MKARAWSARLVVAICLPVLVAGAPGALAAAQGSGAPGPGASTTTSTSSPPGAPTSTGLPSTTGPSSTTTTTVLPGARAQAVLASAISAANSERGLTWRATVKAGGLSETFVGQSGREYGSQEITVGQGTGGIRLQVVLAKTKLFVSGDAAALQGVLSLKPSVAQRLAGRWILLSPAAGTVYQALSDGLTVASTTVGFNMVGSLQLLPVSMVGGVPALGVRGTRSSQGVTVTETLYVRASGRQLPVELVTSAGGVSETVLFSNWGRRARVTVPSTWSTWSKSWL